MGFLDRLLARAEKPRGKERDGLTLHAGGTLDVVGESYRQPALEKAARIATGPEPYLEELKGRARARARTPNRRWFRAALVREPNNPHDRNAIAVHASRAGHIGYLDRQAAVDYGPVFEELQRQGVSIGACPAYLTGGDGYSWGAVLCISSPEVVVEDLRASG